MMDLKRLRYFCRVVEQGSVSQAAKSLNMAQPPLSKRIQELEEELQVSLFVRRGNRIETTEAGFFLYRKACEILRQVEDTARETTDIAYKNRTELRIGLTHLYQNYFKALLMEVYRRHPDTSINISVTDSSHLETLLTEGAIDFALIQRPYRSEGFDYVSFDPIKLVAVINKRCLPGPPSNPYSYTSLAALPLVLLHRAKDSGTYEMLMELFRKSGINAKVIMHITQPGVILDWLESGLQAATLLPSSEVEADKLSQCYVVDVFPSPQIFYPALVKLPSMPYLPALMDIITHGYPFNTSV